MLYFIGLGLCDEKDITVRSADSRLYLSVMSRVRFCSIQKHSTTASLRWRAIRYTGASRLYVGLKGYTLRRTRHSCLSQRSSW
jgi:hypothetical protein